MAYTSLNFVPGEILTAAKMNLLAANDASLRDGTGILDNSIQSRHIRKSDLNKVLYTESPYKDISTQYANVQTGNITIPRSGEYLLIGSFHQRYWKNGQAADVSLRIAKGSNAEIDVASFNTLNWHFGFIQKKATLSTNEKVYCFAQVQQAVLMNLSSRLSVIPLSVY